MGEQLPDERKALASKGLGDALEALKAERPSISLAADRSPKGRQTVAAILKAARTVFIREGHAGLTMRMVAEEADIVVGNISYYFPTKRDLLAAMLREEMVDYVEENLNQFAREDGDPVDILLNTVEFYVRNSRTSYRFFFQMWGYAGSDEEAKELIRELYRPIGRFIYKLVRAAKPDLAHDRAKRVVLQLCSLEEGLKLFIGMGPEDDEALQSAETDFRDLAQRIIEAA